jgi:hypothetical protein
MAYATTLNWILAPNAGANSTQFFIRVCATFEFIGRESVRSERHDFIQDLDH